METMKRRCGYSGHILTDEYPTEFGIEPVKCEFCDAVRKPFLRKRSVAGWLTTHALVYPTHNIQGR